MLRRRTNGREDADSVKPDRKKVMNHSELCNLLTEYQQYCSRYHGNSIILVCSITMVYFEEPRESESKNHGLTICYIFIVHFFL